MAAHLVAAVVLLTVSVTDVAAQTNPMPINMALPETNLTAFRLPDPPMLEGALAPNSWLAKANKYMSGQITGPESMVVANGYIYTGLANGWVVEISPRGVIRKLLRLSYISLCRSQPQNEAACGRPLGIRAHNNKLIVVDAYKGIFRIDPYRPQDFKRPRNFEQLVNARNVNGKGIQLQFINDLAVTQSGLIFFTSSSARHTRKDFMNVILEGDMSGRVLVYNPGLPEGSRVSQLVGNIHFPNGLQLAKDESYLLVAEGARAKIYRVWLKGEKNGTIDTFVDNLPGFVDNVRLSPRGTYWVAISSVRYAGKPGVLDNYGPKPRYRQLILELPHEELMGRAPKYGMVVELNDKGQIIRSLHDPTGTLFSAVSEVQEDKGLLFLGSFSNDFIGVLPMRNLQPPITPPPPPPVTQPPPVVSPPTGNQNVDLLRYVNAIIKDMDKERLHQIILVLVPRLLEVRADSIRAVERANRLQQQLNEVVQMKPDSVTGATITTTFSGAADPAAIAPAAANTTPFP